MTRATTSTLALEDIQGNILRGYGFGHCCHLVLSVTDAVQTRRWLGESLERVTPATPWTAGRPGFAMNLAFTHAGLAASGVDDASLESFPPEFQEGLRARATHHVGDIGDDAPAQWQSTGLHDPAAHVLVMVHATTADELDIVAEDELGRAATHGLELVAREQLHTLPNGAEHFGFVDGVSQPAVEGTIGKSSVMGNGTDLGDGKYRQVRAGEFILGYPDEEEDSPPLPSPTALVRNGSYLVCRKLEQDVAAFRQLVARLAEMFGLEPAEVGTLLVGRRPNGSSVPNCPVASHIHRANPRNTLGLKPELISRHRLIRRGMPYGPQLDEGVLEDDGVPRGLMFAAHCASISRQFEFVQREWLNDGNRFGVGRVQDVIAGHGSAPRRAVIEADGEPPLLVTDVPELVRVRGGGYLFQPGLGGLRWLATLGASVDR